MFKEIRKIIGPDTKITINVVNDDVWFEIYDIGIPIVVDTKSKSIYIDTEVFDGKITSDMLDELYQICKLLESNMSEILSWIEE